MTILLEHQLYTCPFCGQHGYTRIGLRQHFCTRAPALGDESPRTHKGSRKLTHAEWFEAVKAGGTESPAPCGKEAS